MFYDLTTLQKEANTKLNFSADKTLSIAQKLYEGKLISYPRTGSRYISQDVFEEIPERFINLEQYTRFSGYAAGMKGKALNPRPVNDGKVTDHHALIVTENLPGKMEADEQAIYDLIAGRMLEAFSEKCVKDVTSVTLECAGSLFTVKGSVTKSAGWRAVFAEKEDGEDNTALPVMQDGNSLPLSGIELLEKQTKPKPLHTESSLLSSMETAGKELENAELKASMKDTGIGTPATRAAIIETLFSRQYIIREKKNLVPTEKGLAVYNIIRDKKIADVEMTGMWENTLAKIETVDVDDVSVSGMTEDYQTDVDIRDYLPDGVSVVDIPPEITVNISITKLEDKKLTVTANSFVLDKQVDGYQYEVTINNFTITASGFADVVSKLTLDDVVPTIDCSGLPVGNHGNVTVTLKEIDGVTYTMSGTVSVNVTNAENK